MQRLSRFLLIGAAIALVVMLGAFVRAWTLAFNSDFAIVGLLAKRFLEQGELPIFIGQVGYQGLLVEVPAVALAYRIFGINRYSLNIAPALFTCALVYLFYRVVRQSSEKLVASLATLCLVVSSSYWYHQVARTQPNYVETFAFGLLLFRLYASFLKARGPEVKGLETRDYRTIAAFGFVAGFAYYIYGQILYFIVAVGLHALMLYLRDAYRREESRGGWKRVLWPSGGGWPERAVGAVTIFVALLWLAMAVVGRYEFRDTPIKLRTSPFANLVLLLLSYGLLHGLSFVRQHHRTLVKHAKAIGCGLMAFVVGYSPKLYYNFVLGLPSVKRAGIAGYWHDAVRRFEIAFSGNLSFLNVDRGRPLDWILGLSLVAAFTWFFCRSVKLAWRVVTAKREWTAALEISPVAWLPVPILGLFVLSDGVIDAMSVRYTTSLWLFYALAVASSAVSLWNAATKFPWAKLASVALVVVFLTNNAVSFARTVREAPDGSGLEPVIAYLNEKKLRYGYGYFWYAYAINLQTNEEIVIDSVDPKYLPFYEAQVAEAREIAYIDKEPYQLDINGASISIQGRSYRVLDKTRFNEMSVFRLVRE